MTKCVFQLRTMCRMWYENYLVSEKWKVTLVEAYIYLFDCNRKRSITEEGEKKIQNVGSGKTSKVLLKVL